MIHLFYGLTVFTFRFLSRSLSPFVLVLRTIHSPYLYFFLKSSRIAYFSNIAYRDSIRPLRYLYSLRLGLLFLSFVIIGFPLPFFTVVSD